MWILTSRASEGQFCELFGWMCMKCEVQNCKMWVFADRFFSAFVWLIFFSEKFCNVVYPTKSLNPILKLFFSGFTVDTPVWLACGITERRSDLPGDYLKTNQNVLLQGRKWMWGFCSKVYEMRIGLTENIRMREKAHNANSNSSTALVCGLSVLTGHILHTIHTSFKKNLNQRKR